MIAVYPVSITGDALMALKIRMKSRDWDFWTPLLLGDVTSDTIDLKLTSPLAPCTPSGSRRANGIKRFAPTDTPNGFPRGKQSARFALPCAPLVVCLNSGSLTAFGGCIHWIPASLRSPLETFGRQSWQETHGTSNPTPSP